MTTLDEQITQDIIAFIESGDVDESLGRIQGAALRRQRTINFGKGEQEVPKNQAEFRVGNTVKVVGKLKPNYLFGYTFEVLKVNTKTCLVDIPPDPKYRKFAGQKIRIPKSGLAVVA